MYDDTIAHFTDLAARKLESLRRSPGAFVAGSLMAGAYVGLGILLIFSVGAPADPAYRKLIMGVSFGIALTLVVFAGSELFTGHNMYMMLGWLKRRCDGFDVALVWIVCWLGNLAGAAALAFIFVAGGGGGLLDDGGSLVYRVAESKMTAPVGELIARAILCNWLVCLALWMSARMEGDAAKCIAIFWCLFAFIASGFEHSVANMTLFSVALLGDPPANVNFIGMGYNLLWVTIGNIVGGGLFVGAGYWIASGGRARAAAPAAEDHSEHGAP